MQSTLFQQTSSNTSLSAGLDDEQQSAIALMQRGDNLFLTGMAGTGKSHTLLSFIAQAFQRVDVCATTGIAAINLQENFRIRAGIGLPAATIYRWAGIGLGPAPGQTHEAYFGWLNQNPPYSRLAAFRRVAAAQCLVIDEISMLPGRIVDYLDYHFRAIRQDLRPFGGIQVIAVGDWCQLPPVAKTGRYDWAFLCDAWKKAHFRTAYLQTIHRQDEPDFIAALNAFRLGRISQSVADTLAARVQMFVDRKVVRLMTHNSQVDKWNAYQIGEIEAPDRTYEATFTGPEHEADFLAKNSITPVSLTLKEGARVMVTTNIVDADGGHGELLAVNGQCGTVLHLGDDMISVRLDGGREAVLQPKQWSFDPQREDSGTMTQIPLRPAYAMTIHKSQGLTLDRAHIDIRAAREPGQAYVALSRLRSMGGLYLKEWIKGVHVSPAAIAFYEGLR